MCLNESKFLMEFGCLPYIMRHKNYVNSPFRGTYINLARWCNQPNMFKKLSYREFVKLNQYSVQKECATSKYTNEIVNAFPEIEKYFDIRFKKG